MVRETANYDLGGRNTFRMKVSCGLFVEYDTPADLAAIDFASLPQPVIHIGGGSNLLFTGDFPGTVLHSNIKYYNLVADNGDEVLVEVGAGVVFDDFCAWAADKELWGAENLSGIPGEVGAAAVQNIGAYGAEVKDIISQVKCFDRETGREVTFAGALCGYGYRDSMFKNAPAKGRYIVTAVLLQLSRSAGPNLSYAGLRDALDGAVPESPAQVRDVVLRVRGGKLPDPAEIGSAGSFFKNPVVPASVFDRVATLQAGASFVETNSTPLTGKSPLSSSPDLQRGGRQVPHYVLQDGTVKIPAAWLIDQCGLKGAQEGGAAVYERQPLVIINRSGNASPADIIALEQRIIRTVRDRFGITLSPEVEHI